MPKYRSHTTTQGRNMAVFTPNTTQHHVLVFRRKLWEPPLLCLFVRLTPSFDILSYFRVFKLAEVRVGERLGP